MNTIAKLSAFGAALALVIGGAYGVGAAVGPLDAATASPEHSADADADGTGHGDGHRGSAPDDLSDNASDLPGGLASSLSGYTFTPTVSTLALDDTDDFTFRITGPGGEAVTAFDIEHDRRMHLIVVRRDGSAFQHLHPTMAPDGTWSVPLPVRTAGSYRAFADFTPTGAAATTLGVDLTAPGLFEPITHLPTRTASVDGYEVTLAGDLVGGQASPLTLTVHRDGQPVTDLEPYLGAYGHLVALREGDLAYLHVHPDGEDTSAGPDIPFVADVPTEGRYRLFLDFRHDGVVRTAEFTVPTGPAVPDAATTSPTAGHADDSHGH
ncbi:hypothetical protein CC117_09415 [Parafrankia colletiae]|uniref:Secreted protein n=1 Tax=Parafrankia colletiae TaxID=573497 RepID=A0A1S1RGL2_9ACTN|nr:hypothetical protein [Parafrankia colletiae]MCK9899298.1 hypothetical protein [Frankia sp. Cpl3]OHV45958.1 hypothetical protein CC117_09415 [Parafrankia colletiae]